MAATTCVSLDRGNNTMCIVHLHGATVVSWRVNNQEQLFVSKQAVFDGRVPIRGGVPFVFPQSGDGAYGAFHGFARIKKWTLEKAPERLTNGDIEAVFSIKEDTETFTYWRFQFKIIYRIVLKEKQLHFDIIVSNPSKIEPFTFQLQLQTYFKVSDVRQCKITGFYGCEFIDRTLNKTLCHEEEDAVIIDKLTERLYYNTPHEHIITDFGSERNMRIQKYNFPDTMIWNPWIDFAKVLTDFADDEYLKMVCIEAGHVVKPVILRPGQIFEAGQILQILAMKKLCPGQDMTVCCEYGKSNEEDTVELLNACKMRGEKLLCRLELELEQRNWLQGSCRYFKNGS